MKKYRLIFFEVEITNLVAPDQDEARVFVKPYLYRICRTLSFFLSQNNCNKHSYQPRVETDVEHAVWGRSVYEPFETLLQKKEDFVETTLVDGKKYQVITMESAPIVISEYSCAAEPPVRGGVSHLSRRNEPL